jgi:hypothetical protein
LRFRSAAATAAPSPQHDSPDRGITRRRLIATGGAAGAAAVVGFRPWDPAPAHAADGDTPPWLRRASYLALSSPNFSSSRLGTRADLELVTVGDLSDPKLANRDDAFVLTFKSATTFPSGTRTVAHDDLGVFDLFVAPVEGNDGYEAIVNRSVGVPKRAPQPPKPPPAGSKPPPPKHVRVAAVQSARLRRVGKGLVAQVALDPNAHVKSVTAWLTLGGVVVAATEVRHVRGRRRLHVALSPARRPRGGRYELTVGTKDRHGHTEYKRVKIALQ